MIRYKKEAWIIIYLITPERYTLVTQVEFSYIIDIKLTCRLDHIFAILYLMHFVKAAINRATKRSGPIVHTLIIIMLRECGIRKGHGKLKDLRLQLHFIKLQKRCSAENEMPHYFDEQDEHN